MRSAFVDWWPTNAGSTDYVVVEDIDRQFDHRIGFNSLKIWTDKYPFDAWFKGGGVLISPALVVFTSNYTLDELLVTITDDPELVAALRRRLILECLFTAQAGEKIVSEDFD